MELSEEPSIFVYKQTTTSSISVRAQLDSRGQKGGGPRPRPLDRVCQLSSASGSWQQSVLTTKLIKDKIS